MKKTTKKTAKKGFTLIELIIVIAILGILAAIIIPRLGGVKDNARLTANRASAKAIQGALENYHAQYDKYPDTTEASSTDCTPSGNFAKYLSSKPTYKAGDNMITSYAPDATNDTYNISFADDPGTGGVKENTFTMNKDTDTETLFK